MRISKSKYVSYVLCPKRFYLECFHRDLANTSAQREGILSSGTEIGDLAMPLFGSFIDVTTTNSDGILDINEMINKTRALMDEGYETICEASFLNNDLYCAVDILHREDNGYSIYEVKSVTELEDYHLIDVAFQTYLLKSLGIKIKSSNVVYIDKGYMRFGQLDIHKLFKIEDVSERIIPLMENIPANLNKIHNLLKEANIPSYPFSKSCEKPYECPFKDYCYKDLKKPNVFDLRRCSKRLDYYKRGLVSFNDLYNSEYFNPKGKGKGFSEAQRLQIAYEVMNIEPKVDKLAIKEFLNTIRYPLYLLDFESIMPAVPQYNKTYPYQQIPFQYSLHIIQKPGERPIHKEFLAEDGVNPLRSIAIALINDIPRDAQLMAYNASFEMHRIKELAKINPELEEELNHRLSFVDLMLPFQKHYIYKKEFQGSYSIKYVLPGLFPNDPELDYHNLNLIHNGSEAMSMFEHILDYPKEERLKIRESLLRYCELDTYAMVKILNKLYELVE